jgi:protein O-GlcNAc transferase
LNEDEHLFAVSEEIHRALEVCQSDFAHGIKILSDLADQLSQKKEVEEGEELKKRYQLLISEVYLNMGIIYEENGLLEGAGKSYEEAVKHNESNILALYHYAVFVQPIDPQDSLNHYLKLIQLDANFIEAYINVGNIEMELDHPLQAEEAYLKAIQCKMSGDDEEKFFYESKALAHHNLGLFYYDANKVKSAVKNFEMSITYNPKASESYECLANLYEVEGNKEAVAKYRNLLDTNFSDYVHNINYVEGKSFYEDANYEEAKKCFEKALGLTPNDMKEVPGEKKKEK